MKISKIFHFLYFSVLSIPLISMPIFAIYSQNHEITGYEVTQEVNKAVDFNQLNGEGYSYNPYQSSNIEIQQTNYYSFRAIAKQNVNVGDPQTTRHLITLTGRANHTYIIRFEFATNTNGLPYFEMFRGLGVVAYQVRSPNNIYTYKFTLNSAYTSGTTNLGLGTTNALSTDDFYEYANINLFDLTQMGLQDITIEQFNTYFDDNYYQYTQSQEVVIENYDTITYNDTDIMSQFIYNEYNFMKKYLGIYKFSPFNDIYNWLQNTFFGGAAPMVFIIFYQWFAYWLFVSLCWLIFDVLMYVPLMIHKWLDKAEL